MLAVQGALATLGYLMAFALAYNFTLPDSAFVRFLGTLPYLLAVRVLVAHRFGIDAGYWRHVGLRDLLRLAAAVLVGSLLFPVVLIMVEAFWGLPPMLFVVEGMCTLGLWAGVRVGARWWHEHRRQVSPARGQRAVVIGAGEAGEQLVRQMLHDARHRIDLVGLIDDDPAKVGRALHGLPVFGSSDDLRRLAAVHQVTLALIAIPSITAGRLQRLVDRCAEARVDVKLVPPLRELVSGDVRISDYRDIQIEDLLGREPVQLDLRAAKPDLAGKVVLVTGAAGSIGSELVRQIAQFHPVQLILIDRAESPLNDIYLETSKAHPEIQVVPVLASVTNAARMMGVFEAYRPDCVFHAAAYKHVPMLEWNVVEGVWNNVFGTLRAAECAAKTGTAKFVLISTDKAVNPTSILGATKRIAERIVLEHPTLSASATDFRVVRFGNVLGSDGSVVPLFQRQLAAGGPLTVTHPEVRRYFMTIPEAVQLVLHAAALPEAAERIALLEMGRQIRILDLAEQLIRLAGLLPYKDIDITFTGLRPGEKLHEELVGPDEAAGTTSVDKIRVVERNGAHRDELARRLRHLARMTSRRDELATVRALAALAPEYRPPLKLHGNGSPAPSLAVPPARVVGGASGHAGMARPASPER